MFDIHRGPPRHHTVIRFLSGSIFVRKPELRGQDVFYSREIVSWLGISWRGKWFFGFIRTGPQTREDVAMSKSALAELAASQ